jgi:ADP-sugar diphosphatase
MKTRALSGQRKIATDRKYCISLSYIYIRRHNPLLTACRVGFVKLKADVTVEGKRVPGICFLRGMGVGMLVSLLCKDTKQEYCVLVQQPRIPVGEGAMLELPAGMLDDSGTFTGVAAAELKEECGLTIQESDLTDLTELAYNEAGFRGVCPSAGGCDEYIRLLYCQFESSQDEINNMQGRLGGLRDHGEVITLRVEPLKEVWKICCDAKAIG